MAIASQFESPLHRPGQHIGDLHSATILAGRECTEASVKAHQEGFIDRIGPDTHCITVPAGRPLLPQVLPFLEHAIDHESYQLRRMACHLLGVFITTSTDAPAQAGATTKLLEALLVRSLSRCCACQIMFFW